MKATKKPLAFNMSLCLLVAPALLSGYGTNPTRQQIGAATGTVRSGGSVGTVADAAGGVIGAEIAESTR